MEQFTFTVTRCRLLEVLARAAHPWRANPSLHPRCYSGLHPLPHLGELKRWG